VKKNIVLFLVASVFCMDPGLHGVHTAENLANKYIYLRSKFNDKYFRAYYDVTIAYDFRAAGIPPDPELKRKSGPTPEKSWHLVADGKAPILNFKVLHNPSDSTIGLLYIGKKNFCLQALGQKNEVRFIGPAFGMPEEWNLLEDVATNYYLKSRASSGYLCVTDQETNSFPTYSYEDIVRKAILDPLEFESPAVKKLITDNQMIVYQPYTAWTSLPKITEFRAAAARKVEVEPEPPPLDLVVRRTVVNAPSPDPLTKQVKEAQLAIEIHPDYQIGLPEIKSISNRAIALQEKSTGKYFRVHKVRKKYWFSPLADDTSSPLTQFRFTYKNIKGEYWLALASEVQGPYLFTLQSDKVKDPEKTSMPNRNFDNWASWEMSGASLDSVVLMNKASGKFLDPNGELTKDRASAAKISIKRLSLARQVRGAIVRIKYKKLNKYFVATTFGKNIIGFQAKETVELATQFLVLHEGKSNIISLKAVTWPENYFLHTYPYKPTLLQIGKFAQFEVRLVPGTAPTPAQKWELSGASLTSCYLRNIVTNSFLVATRYPGKLYNRRATTLGSGKSRKEENPIQPSELEIELVE
jgi:hypothetical protein